MSDKDIQDFGSNKSKGILSGLEDGPDKSDENDLAEKARKRDRVKRTYSISKDTINKLEKLADDNDAHKSEIVEIAVEELFEKYAGK